MTDKEALEELLKEVWKIQSRSGWCGQRSLLTEVLLHCLKSMLSKGTNQLNYGPAFISELNDLIVLCGQKDWSERLRGWRV